MDPVRIREMTADDWSAIEQIYRDGMDSGIATFQMVCPTYEQWDARYLKRCRLVAVSGEKVLGWVAVSPYSTMKAYDGVAEVSVYVDSASHGAGIGTLLLEAVSDHAERAGIWTLLSKIILENKASIKLHEKCGFRLVGRHERIARDRFGIWHDSVLMERRSRKI